ncbi:unnamed protein product, partial [Amoebophrya sp. A25]
TDLAHNPFLLTFFTNVTRGVYVDVEQRYHMNMVYKERILLNKKSPQDTSIEGEQKEERQQEDASSTVEGDEDLHWFERAPPPEYKRSATGRVLFPDDDGFFETVLVREPDAES